MDNERKQQLTVSKEELVPYIKNQGIKLAENMMDARKKFGNSYNKKNNGYNKKNKGLQIKPELMN